MSDRNVKPVAPQSQDWGAFDCGDARINDKLIREAHRAQAHLQQFHGAFADDQLCGLLTLRAGHLSAPVRILSALGMGEIDVPTLHIEVLAVRVGHQRLGLGQLLITHALSIGSRLQHEIGLKAVSLAATPESRAFYIGQGFECATSPWPDGSWPIWFLLR